MQRLPMLSSARTGWKAQYLKATLQEQDASIGAAKDTLTSLLSSCHEDVVYLSLASLWSRTGAGQQVKDIIEQALQRQPNNNELLDVLIASLLEVMKSGTGPALGGGGTPWAPELSKFNL